jgi:prepilin-type processing-associated H-X9-DG protein
MTTANEDTETENGNPGPALASRSSYGLSLKASGVALAKFNFVAECFILGDKTNSYWYIVSQSSSAGTYYNGRSYCATTRHNEGMNCGFADGHAKWLKGSNIPNDDYEPGNDDKPMNRFWDPTAD